MATIGWDQQRTDEVLVPVIRDMNRREQEGTQSNITNFFNGTQGAGAFAPRAEAATSATTASTIEATATGTSSADQSKLTTFPSKWDKVDLDKWIRLM